jgi:hypothetical protein
MTLTKGSNYIYTNTVKVGRNCKRMQKQLNVIYMGSEGNKEVFETETGSELLIHKDDVEKLIRRK